MFDTRTVILFFTVVEPVATRSLFPGKVKVVKVKDILFMSLIIVKALNGLSWDPFQEAHVYIEMNDNQICECNYI